MLQSQKRSIEAMKKKIKRPLPRSKLFCNVHTVCLEDKI